MALGKAASATVGSAAAAAAASGAHGRGSYHRGILRGARRRNGTKASHRRSVGGISGWQLGSVA